MKRLLLSTLMLPMLAHATYTKVLITQYPALEAGLNLTAVEQCNKTVDHECVGTQKIQALMDCASDAMQGNAYCKQNYAFLEHELALVRSAKDFGNIGLLYAQVVSADHNDGYFMVDKKGNVIKPTGNLDIRKAKNYGKATKLFPKLELSPSVTAPPAYHKLSNGQQTLTFQQVLVNGCHACEQAGVARVTFKFDAKGNYLGVSIPELLINVDDKPIVT